MSGENPYNSLGQILSDGGEIALGLALRYGWTDTKIASLFARRFEPMRAEDRTELERIAKEGVAAGDRIQSMADDAVLSLSDLPVNPFLYGDEPEGRRIRVIGRVDITGSGDWREIRLDLSHELEAREIRDRLLQEAKQRSDDSPNGFGKVNDDGIYISSAVIIFGERKF